LPLKYKKGVLFVCVKMVDGATMLTSNYYFISVLMFRGDPVVRKILTIFIKL